MNMEELYEEMKAALKYFGLAFNEMDKVNMSLKDNAVIFTHGKASISVTLD